MISKISVRAIALAVTVLLAGPSAWAGYHRVNASNPEDPMDVHVYRLDNGLTVYLTENHQKPRFYSEIAVRAGSKHDPADATGLAHYLEHLLFKGTQEFGTLDYAQEKPYLDKIQALYEQHFIEDDADERRAIYAEINRLALEASAFAIPGELDKVYNSMGQSHLNAHTSDEETVYKVGLPSNRLRQWAAMESARFVNPVFRLFHTELETVYEEKNRSIDNKGRVINNAVSNLLFKKHPYGQQKTIGEVEHLKRPSLVHIRNYFDTYYVPNNMAISISGDIDIEETMKIIDENFGSWERKDLPEAKTWEEAPLVGAERVSVNYKAEEYVQLAFRTVRHGHPDEEALTLLDFILDNSVAGLINLNLNQQQKVRQAGAYHAFYNDYGVEQFYGVPKEGQTLEEVEQLLLDQVEMIKRGEFEEWIIPAIINDFKMNDKRGLEMDFMRVQRMTNSFLAFDDWDHTVGKIARMEAVTRDEVIEVAKRYFVGNYVAGYRRDAQQDLPSIEKPKIDPVPIDPSKQSEFAKNILGLPFDQIEPVFVDSTKDYTVVEADTGVKLYYAPNPVNDLFSFSIQVEFGTHEDNTIAIATQLLDKSGIEGISSLDLQKEWYKLGSSFAIGAGENETFIQITGLDEKFEETLGLMLQLVTNPVSDPAVLEELKKIILVRREDAKKEPRTIARALSEYVRYGDDSYYLRMLPADALEKLTVDELNQVIQNLLKFKHTITYTGSLPLDSVLEILARKHPTPGSLNEPPAHRFRRARRAEGTEIFLYNKASAQSQVRIEFPDGVYTAEDGASVELYNQYFGGGMSSIVFQELRESRGLAYSAQARYVKGGRVNDENLMIGVIQCQTDKTSDALAAFFDLFDEMPQSEERFEETSQAIINVYRTSPIGFRNVLGSVRGWERLGLDGDPREKRFAQVESAEMSSMLDFYSTHIKGKPKLVSIVGESSKIDLDALAKLGTVITVDEETIFIK